MEIRKPQEFDSGLEDALKSSSLALLSAAFDPSVDEMGHGINLKIAQVFDSQLQ